MKKILRFYISHEISYGVAVSQIFNWSMYLGENGIDTVHLIFYTDKDNLKSMVDGINQNIRHYKSYRKPIIRDIVYLFHLFQLLVNIKNKSQTKIVFQTRFNGMSFSFLILRLFFSFNVIYDIRGFGEKQIIMNSPLTFLKRLFYIRREKQMINLSDKVYCVSDNLRETIIKQLKPTRIKDKFEVFPCAASAKDFYFNERIRLDFRRKFEIKDNSLILIYSGNIDKPWQIPDQIFRFFKFIGDMIESKLFILTPNIEMIQQFLIKYKIDSKSIFYTNCPYSELNYYYNAADYGILLRQNMTLNNVSSPTKFSEYILSGLPVLITDSIIDYSDFVRKHETGFVIPSIALEIDEEVNYRDLLSRRITKDNLKFLSVSERSKIADLGKNYLSKECFLNHQINTLRSFD